MDPHRLSLELSPGLTFAVAQGRTILMDRRSGRYTALAPDAEKSFQDLIASAGRGSLADPGLRSLVERGVLRPSDGGAILAICAVPAAQRSFLEDSHQKAPARLIARAAVDHLLARIDLRRHSFGKLFDQLDSRARALPIEVRNADPLFEEAAAAFRDCRLIETGADRCLVRSVALVRHLYRRGLRAQLIFGVQTRPFVAHCWVQVGDVLLNDHLEHSARFTPIAAVGC